MYSIERLIRHCHGNSAQLAFAVAALIQSQKHLCNGMHNKDQREVY